MHLSITARRILSAAICAAMTAAMAVSPVSPVFADTVTVGKTLTTTDGTNAYRGQTADLATSGLKKISVYVTVTGATGTTVDISYGFGIGLDAAPWWIEMDHGKFTQTPADPDDTGTSISIPAGVSTPIEVDVSALNVKYDTGQYAGEYEFRNYYVSSGTLRIDKVVPNDSASTTPTTPTTPDDNTGKESNNTKSGAYSFVDNGDGTATISTTLTGCVDDIDMVLTAGKDEDYYKDLGETYEEGMPINSRKITYAEFGLPTPAANETITVESFGFAIESEANLDQFQYGCGLNVANKSDSDTEYWIDQARAEDDRINAGYWYNEHGTDEDGNYTDSKGNAIDVSLVPIEIGTGTKMKSAGTWIETVWDVPTVVQPDVSTKRDDAVSFQFWYADDADAEEYTAVDEVTLKSATCTYTITKTVPYTASKSLALGTATKLTQGSDTTNTGSYLLTAPGDDEDVQVVAVKFTVETSESVKKLVFGTGISDTSSADQYSDFQYAILNSDTTQEIMWIIPNGVTPDSAYGSVNLGYYYGADADNNLVDSLTVKDVTVYYYVEPEQTTTTASSTTSTTSSSTTTTTTTTAPQPETADWGNVDCSAGATPAERVEVLDAIMLARIVAEDQTVKVTDKGKVNANVDYQADGTINGNDLTKLLQYLAGIIPYSDLGNQ